MPTDYKDLMFSRSEIKILKNIQKNGKISKSEVHDPKNDQYLYLLKYKMLDYCKNDYKCYCLSDKAKMFLRYRLNEKLRFWIPIIISILALIISIVSIAVPQVILVTSLPIQ